jgi:hypothetical protein
VDAMRRAKDPLYRKAEAKQVILPALPVVINFVPELCSRTLIHNFHSGIPS